jgi:hypothetical protein
MLKAQNPEMDLLRPEHSPARSNELNSSRTSEAQVEQSIGHAEKNWTLELSNYLAILSYKCARMAWLHDEDAQHFHYLDKVLTASSSLASVISSLTITAVMGLFEKNKIVFYTLTASTIILNLFVTLINTWTYIYDYTSRVLSHSDKQNKYQRLHRKITSQFVLPLEERYSAKTLMEYTTERMAELEREQPFNRSSTNKRWSSSRIDFFDQLFTYPSELHGSDEDERIRLRTTIA